MERELTEYILKEAETLKEHGNVCFVENRYEKAIDFYTQAVEKAGANREKAAIYLCNRAFANIKLENYGCGLIDSDLAIEADPKFPKSYYRKSSCLFALGKLDEALRVLETIVKDLKLMNITEVNEKIKYLKNLKKEKQFLECLQYEDEMEKINENDLHVEETYSGPVLEEDTVIDFKWIEDTLAYLKSQKKLHKKYLWILIKHAKQILDKEANIVNVDVNGSDVQAITVCGDIHGQFYDFLNIFKLNGYPSTERPYLFNGDFVDRGSFSVECMIGLMIFKVWNPACIYLNRGNHENPDLNKMYGFEGEVLAKYCTSTFLLFKNLFYHLPLAHIINKKVLVLHGGLFEKEGVKLDDIMKIQRRIPVPSTGLMCDMLWADPTTINGRHKSKRGVSIEFGPDVAIKFLEENDLSNVIRPIGPITSSQGHGLRSRVLQKGNYHIFSSKIL